MLFNSNIFCFNRTLVVTHCVGQVSVSGWTRYKLNVEIKARENYNTSRSFHFF